MKPELDSATGLALPCSRLEEFNRSCRKLLQEILGPDSANVDKVVLTELGELLGGAKCRKVPELATPNTNPGRLLQIVLKDRKTRPLAFLEVEPCSAQVSFGREDELIATLFAAVAETVMEIRRVLDTLRDMLKDFYRAGNARDVLRIILDRSVTLLRADRGDLSVWDETHGQLSIWLRHGATQLPEGKRLPDQSLVRQAWEQQRSRLIPNVHYEPSYFACDSLTQSEVVVPLTWRGRRIGVLNLESRQPNGFDQQDLALAELVAHHAANAYALIGKEPEFDPTLMTAFHRPPDEILESLLESLRDIYRFESGIVYVPDHRQRQLRGIAFIGCEGYHVGDQEFTYGFDEVSLATKVYADRDAYFSPDADCDPIVNVRGREAFRIRGPILGIPLLVREEMVGVLVVWNRTDRSPTPDDARQLVPIARLAAEAISLHYAGLRREEFIKQVEHCLTLMQTRFDLDANLDRIVRAIHHCNFDRVRVFRFRFGDCFVGYSSLGMPDPNTFRHRILLLERNPFAKHLVEICRDEPWARFYPSSPDAPLDPEASDLCDPPDLPRVVVPIVSAGKLYGQIVADCQHSRRRLTELDREYLTIFGALAGRAFSLSEERGMLIARTLSTLYKHVGTARDRLVVVRCLLRYLTHGEEGLGFSRALFFEPDERQESWRFVEAIGQTTDKDFKRVAAIVRDFDLDRVLADSHTSCDPKLNEACHDMQLKWGIEWLLPQRLGHAAEYARPLLETLKSNDVLVVPIRTEDRPLGLFVVDRCWQFHGLGDADLAVSETFAHEAGRLLVLHELQKGLRLSQERATLGFLTAGLIHEVRTPLAAVGSNIRVLDKHFVEGSDARAREAVRYLAENVGELCRTVASLENIVRPEGAHEETAMSEFFLDLQRLVRERSEELGIDLRFRIPPDLPRMQVIRSLLSRAILNLLSNAEAALQQSRAAIRVVTVDVRCEDGKLVATISDNGPGMSRETLTRVRAGAYSTTRGLGIGLELVRKAADLHRGTLNINSEVGAGTSAVLTLPVEQ